MRKEKKLKLLERAISKEGYKIRYEKGNFIGGDCRLHNHNIVVVNKFLPVEGKIYTLAKVISKLPEVSRLPEVRTIIENYGFGGNEQLPFIDEP
ncbi:MAG TPA: hypothetical protein ENN50_01345 [Prosthecochloris aestuarii]|uniref:Uncharacterized protein n=1 Tax=Prosthecochloris aestuarii TaxID=1102 RepID=A0A831WU45_PROAE|nr:hypothetical protein [Prosthecochloris aestuarii]